MKKLFPVIHYKDDQTSIENAKIAYEEGCDGIFLIEMSGRDNLVLPIASKLKSKYPDQFIARNCLTVPANEAILTDYEDGLDGLWIDNPGLYSDKETFNVELINDSLRHVWYHNKEFKFYGSVAFKTHLYHDPDPGLAAHKAIQYGWIPTTSGVTTGQVADLAKIINIAACLRTNEILAMASGTTVNNIDMYLPYVAHFLVATGISKSFYEFDIKLVHQMAQKIKEYNKAHH